MTKKPTPDDAKLAADTPLPFDPRRLHTRKEFAEGFRIKPRTVDRWTAQGLIERRSRYLGHDLNRLWQSKK